MTSQQGSVATGERETCTHEWVCIGTGYKMTPDPHWSLIPVCDDYECKKCHTELRVHRFVAASWARDNLTPPTG